ncbi:MAG: SdrD B-like domain-containing protein, partial [Thermoflexales bacterium]
GKGGALVYLNSYIYGTRGNGSKPFYRYDPATNTWSDAAVADVPANVTGGGSLATDGKLIYLLVGGNKTFDRFDPAAGAAGTWTIRASAPQNIGDGGALALVPGTASVAKSTVMNVNQTMINSGQKITLTMSLQAATNLMDTFSPSALTISDTAQAGGTATCVGPTPASLPSLISGTVGLFTWSCTLTATNVPANITFGGNASRGAPGAFSFPFATSHSVIVVPPLTLTVRVLSPTSVSTIENVAVLVDASGNLGPAPSNVVQTTIGSTLGDFVWADLNGNGLQDVGEPGIPGVVVSLSLPGGSVVTAITDPNGNYFFGNLGTGTFTVTYNLATAPAGFIPTTPTQITVTLASNQVITTVDFGLLPPNTGTIGDQVWLDANNDGVYDPNTESPLPNIGVNLYADANRNGILDPSDPVVATMLTSITGTYQFSNLAPFTYFVSVNTASVVTSSLSGVSNGITSTLGASMTPTVGTTLTRTFALASGQVITTADFGFNWAASIGDYVWYDSNGNGIQNDAGDEGGAPFGVIELVYDVNGDGVYQPCEPLVVYSQTSASGLYLFPNLPPGNYIVEAEGQAIPAPASTGALSGTVNVMMPTTPAEIVVSLGGNQAYRAADFGFAAGATVVGTVFYDENSNGNRDPLETTGFGGVVVTLTSSSGAVLTTTTLPDGSYAFRPVLPGTFTVTYNTAAPVLANFSLQTTSSSETFALVFGEQRTVDFGRDFSGSIGDTVFHDPNNSGTQNPGEPGISGA